ncbi:MAG: hypothetical protein IJC99_05560 [Clostridia bacterium]|nr:hypothetical protein [Clostridia bacterium]
MQSTNIVTVDFARKMGPVKPMHGVNNGPVYKFGADQRITNLWSFQAAGIPYARTHDASCCYSYGGEHTIDVHAIFPDFDADATDPASYDFDITDDYMRVIEESGAKCFYRLGSKIEHWRKKYGTLPPKDYHKWAVICEHIIRHYTEGWANGFHMDVPYWEIWNEPDLDPDDSTHKRCWGGTAKQFYEMFGVAYRHLKACFPHLKIGGPAVATMRDEPWLNDFFASLGDIKPDFFSWHVYGSTVEKVQKRIRLAREMLDRYGLTETESILNEWNYVKGWHDDVWVYSLKAEKGLKGAAFIAAVMEMSQGEPLDNLMFYDARPGAMNSLFNTDLICECLKGYYPFYMFNQLYRQKESVAVETEGDCVWAAAAAGEEQCVMLTHFEDNDEAPAREVKVLFENVENKNGVRVEYYLLDADHDAALVREEIFTASEFAAYLTLPLFSTYLIKIIPL